MSEKFSYEVPIPKTHHVQRFQKIYKEKLGKELNESDALGELINLLVIYRYKEYEKKYKEVLEKNKKPDASNSSNDESQVSG